MGKHRRELVTVVRQELAEARGTARSVLATAEQARGEAQRRKSLVRDAYATCMAQLAHAREAARYDIVRKFTEETTSLTGRVESLAASVAAGPAGSPWQRWEPVDPERAGSPGLLRIGTIPFEDNSLPALVPLLDSAHLVFDGDPAVSDQVITGLLLRALGTTRPGDVRLSVYDPEHLGGTLAAFAPLGTADLMAFVSPGGLGTMLDDLVEQISRVNESVLSGEHSSLAQLTAAAAGPRTEPWRVVVLLVDQFSAADITGWQLAQLDRIARLGVACGVHLLVRGLELTAHPSVHRITAGPDDAASSDLTGDLAITLDPPPHADKIAAFCRSLADRVQNGPGPARLSDLVPEKLFTDLSTFGLIAPIGDGADDELITVPLGDDPQHALIGGPPGSGKTNLIYAWLGSLAARYAPAELAYYLLDFAEGMSFGRLMPGALEPSWLPQVRLAGVNLQDDREFGLTVLRHLTEELQARELAAKRHDATRLSELRADDPETDRPRILVVLEEFPVLLAEPGATELIGGLLRRGGPLGIHLVLSSHDVAGIDALGELAELCTLRMALPKARRVLSENNLAAALIPRLHAVLNTDSGLAGANQVVRLPDASDRVVWRTLQRKLWRDRPISSEPPLFFDGAAVPALPAVFRPSGQLAEETGSAPGAVLGRRLDLEATPVRLRFSRTPGRNLAVIGSRVDEACDVLAAAALSLAGQGPARFSVACLDPAADAAAAMLAAELPDADCYGPDDVPGMYDELRPGSVPHYLIGYGLDGTGDGLRTLLSTGPELRLHVLGWWRSVPALLGDLDGKTDAIGAWVALDVPGPELEALGTEPGGPDWTPRRRRALFFDRSVHRSPEMIIPYEVNSDHA